MTKQISNGVNKTIIGIAVTILIAVGIVWIARPDSKNNSKASVQSAIRSNGTLIAAETSNYDFGPISMAAGKVKHAFKIKNTGAEAVTVNKMYTSCMCTTALLTAGGKQFGPYGMPGHGFIPGINQNINPNEEAIVEVVFDPAAHGPAGVGRIQRTITIENSAGQPVELQFAAVVTP